MIDLENVSKTYSTGVPALEDINLHIDKGEFVFITGVSGSGKSTLIKLLLKELNPTSGRIVINGRNLSKIKPNKLPYLRRDIGVVFQDFRLFEDRNVYENVAFAQKAIEAPGKRIRAKVLAMLSMVGLLEKYKTNPKQLSGGEQQRVILARALTQQTECLVLDEPTNHLDIKYQLEIMDIVKSLDVTVIAAVHDLNIAAMYCDRLIAINEGKVAGIGTPRELLTAEFIKKLYGVDSRVDIEESTGRMNIVYLPRHWKKETPQVST